MRRFDMTDASALYCTELVVDCARKAGQTFDVAPSAHLPVAAVAVILPQDLWCLPQLRHCDGLIRSILVPGVGVRGSAGGFHSNHIL